MSDVEKNISEVLNCKITTYCQMVERGKPAACIAIQERYIDSAKHAVIGYGLKLYTDKLSEGWLSLWIYKYPHILDVIKNAPQVPRTAYDHWILGKLFGYEEAAIGEYIATHFG
jgi:hypothetical protein